MTEDSRTGTLWAGVLPAITTPFAEDGAVDHAFLAHHCRWLIDNGCRGIVALGSLGESATLEFEEKVAILATCVEAVGDRVPVMPGVAALSTAQAVRLAQAAERVGCRGLMVLPPYVHKGPFYEMLAHYEAVFAATGLSCMLYNNPIAYGVDVPPAAIAELVERHPNLHAVKESSGDVRRVTAVRALIGDRLALFAGLDDMILEAVHMGATGWIAGLVNAFPAESVRLVELGRAGRYDEAFALYSWFLPLLRLDCVPEFVQLIKLVQQEVGMGNERVRLPRQPMRGEARESALATIRHAIATRPAI
jgi:4-hydroxy-tetrahydrodipicolinate synthase